MMVSEVRYPPFSGEHGTTPPATPCASWHGRRPKNEACSTLLAGPFFASGRKGTSPRDSMSPRRQKGNSFGPMNGMSNLS